MSAAPGLAHAAGAPPGGPRAARGGGAGAGQRVLIVVENLPVPFDRRVWREAETLARAGRDVTVISPMGAGCEAARERIGEVRILRHPAPPEARGALGYALEYPVALTRALRLALRARAEDGPFDVMMGASPPDLLFLIARVLRALDGTDYVFDHHDLSPELFDAKFPRAGLAGRALRAALVAVERASFRAAGVSIATNESYRAIAEQRGGMAPEDVFVVRSGPNPAEWPVCPPPERRAPGAPVRLGWLGVIGRQEGLEALLEAAAALTRSGRPIRLDIVGDGPDRARVEALAADRFGDAGAVFHGRLPQARLLEILGAADICVNPDAPSEMNNLSTMNKILEFMALAKPIVQFDLREGRRSAGPASLYAAPGDAMDLAAKIAALIDDPSRARRMGLAGRRRIEESLSWAASEPALIAAFDRIADRRALVRPAAVAL